MKQDKFENKIEDYLSGRLDHKEIERLWEEMVKDPARLDYLKHLVNTREAAIDISREKEAYYGKVDQRVSSPYIKYAAAAAIALIIGVLSMFQWTGQEAQEVKPVETIELNYYRSETGDVENSPDRIRDVINQAISMANSGEANKAIEMLKKKRVNVENPAFKASLSLNIGSLQYNAGQYDEAIDNFKMVIERKQSIDVLTLEKGYWFLGNAYFQKGQMQLAREAISSAYELNGAYRRVAGTYLNAMANK